MFRKKMLQNKDKVAVGCHLFSQEGKQDRKSLRLVRKLMKVQFHRSKNRRRRPALG
jgi:hypothetical protein